jgi:putative chitinase
MAIKKSVGLSGVNAKIDMKIIQAALNLCASPKFKLTKKLTVDGKIGKQTYDAIKDYQATVMGTTNPDSRVDPRGATLKSLKKELTKGLSLDALIAIMGHGSTTTCKTYHPLLQTALVTYKINTPLRAAHFFAQVGHESLSFIYTQELASGSAYEGRKDLGNTKVGDGVRFKGRGLIQLTGRANYESYGKYASLDLLTKGNENVIATTPKNALDVSLWFWDKRKLNTHADKDDLRAITRRVNGGYNGLPDRQDYLDRAKFFLIP